MILTALGLWLFTNPASVIVLIQYIFAAILFSSVIDLQGAGEPPAPGLGAAGGWICCWQALRWCLAF